jgi:hypothetical protein
MLPPAVAAVLPGVSEICSSFHGFPAPRWISAFGLMAHLVPFADHEMFHRPELSLDVHEWFSFFSGPWFDLTIPMYLRHFGVSFYVPYVSHYLEKVDTAILEHPICNLTCTQQPAGECVHIDHDHDLLCSISYCLIPHRMFPSHRLRTSRNIVIPFSFSICSIQITDSFFFSFFKGSDDIYGCFSS